jgi:alpha-1,2-mannosyltransferase
MIAQRISPRQTGDTWIIVGLCVFFAVINVQYFFKVTSSERRDSQTAFQRWRPQVLQLDQGINIWKEYNWPNTPVMAMILKPFMNIDPAFFGSQVWLFAKMICAVASIYLVFSMLDQPRHPFPLWGKALTIVLALRPIQGDLFHGNVNLFILLTVVLAIYAFSRGWDVMAGLTLALGIACKITPALFLPYLAWKRAWKALAAACVGVALWLLVVPSFYFGWQRNWDGVSSWVNGMVLPYVVKNEITSEHQNQSLPGLLERIFRHRVAVVHANHPEEFLNIADVSSPALSLVVKSCMAAFCLAVMWRCRAPRNDRTDWRWMAEFGAVVLGMLIFSERTWKHHAVTLLIPFAVIAHQLFAFRLPRGLWWYLTGTIVAVVVLLLLTASGVVTLFGVPDSDDLFGKYVQAYGAYLWSFVLLLIAMFTLSGRIVDYPPSALATQAGAAGLQHTAVTA